MWSLVTPKSLHITITPAISHTHSRARNSPKQHNTGVNDGNRCFKLVCATTFVVVWALGYNDVAGTTYGHPHHRWADDRATTTNNAAANDEGQRDEDGQGHEGQRDENDNNNEP